MKRCKFLIIFLVVAMVVSLTACGKTDEPIHVPDIIHQAQEELSEAIDDVLDEIIDKPSDTTTSTEPSQSTESTTPSTDLTTPSTGPVVTPPTDTTSDYFYKDNRVGIIPNFSGKAYYTINNNEPFFTENEKNVQVFENYAQLDSLGRCGVAYANICKELMPTESRGDISSVHPSGWYYNGKSNNNDYGSLVDGGRVYNRCHLIGFQLAGENDNKLNLVTGTRYMNVTGMLPFENMIDDFVDETNEHVLYRVTPLYVGNELVCRGVLMEAWSVEDEGDSICFNIFCYNVQPGITINYATGQNWLDEDAPDTTTTDNPQEMHYILNTNSKKFHLPTCSACDNISAKNRGEFTGDRQELIDQGYTPCGSCKP